MQFVSFSVNSDRSKVIDEERAEERIPPLDNFDSGEEYSHHRRIRLEESRPEIFSSKVSLQTKSTNDSHSYLFDATIKNDEDITAFPVVSPPVSINSHEVGEKTSSGSPFSMSPSLNPPLLKPSISSFSHAGVLPPPIGRFPSVPYYGLGNSLTIFIGAKKDIVSSSSLSRPPRASETSTSAPTSQDKKHTSSFSSATSSVPTLFNSIHQVDQCLQQTVREHGKVWWLGTIPIDKDPSFTFSDFSPFSADGRSAHGAHSMEGKRYTSSADDGMPGRVLNPGGPPSTASLSTLTGVHRLCHSALRSDQFTKAMIHAFQHMSFLRIAANAIHSYHHSSCSKEKSEENIEVNEDHPSPAETWSKVKKGSTTALMCPDTTTTGVPIKLSAFLPSPPPSFSCMTPHSTYYRLKNHPRWKDVTAMLGIENGQLLLFVCASSRATQQHLSNAAVLAGIKKESVTWDCSTLLLMEPNTHTHRSSSNDENEPQRIEDRVLHTPDGIISQEWEPHVVLVMWNLLSLLPLPDVAEVRSGISDPSETRIHGAIQNSHTALPQSPNKVGSTEKRANVLHEGTERYVNSGIKWENNSASLLTEYQPLRITGCDVVLLSSFSLPEAQCITPQLRLVETQPILTSSSSLSSAHSPLKSTFHTSPATSGLTTDENLYHHSVSGTKRMRENHRKSTPSFTCRASADGVTTGYRYVWKLIGPIRIVHPYLWTHVMHTLVQRCEVGSFDVRYGCDDRLSSMPTTVSGGGILGGVGNGPPRSEAQASEDIKDGRVGFIQYVGRVAQTLDSSATAPRGSSTASSWHCCSRLSYGSWFSLQERELLGTSEVIANDAGEEFEEDFLEAEFNVTRVVFKNIPVPGLTSQRTDAGRCFGFNRSDTFFLPPAFLALSRFWNGQEESPLVSENWNAKCTIHHPHYCNCASISNSASKPSRKAEQNGIPMEVSVLNRWGAYFCAGSGSPLLIHSFFFPHRWPPCFQLWKKVTRVIDLPT